MAVGKILLKALRNFTFSVVAGFGLLLLIKGFVYCPLVDADSSAAPGPGDSSAGPCLCDTPDGFCVAALSRKARDVVAVLLGALGQLMATALFGNPFADDDEEEAGAAKKAGYVAIRDDDVEVGGDGGKIY